MIKKVLYKIRYLINKYLKAFIQFPPYDKSINKKLLATDDPIRYTSIALALNDIKNKSIEGNLAEVGVYQGNTSKINHFLAPERKLYLFDTFEGFPSKFLDQEDYRFKDTTVKILKKKIGDLHNIIIKKGIFPETAKGLENEKFSFVMIDLDIFAPTVAALDFFYPRVVTGGYIFIHDYNNPLESKGDVYKATKEFSANIKENLTQIPDKWGSVIIRKS